MKKESKNEPLEESLFFFAVGRTNLGARFYSETVDELNIAKLLFEDYIDLVNYFGGGDVELYCITEDSYTILYKTEV